MSESRLPPPHEPVPNVEEASWVESFFLLRPTFSLLLSVLLIVSGILAFLSLIKESLPDLEIPQATISTFWMGADPQLIEQEVTEPIEKKIKTLKGLKSLTSASFDSYSVIAVEFDASVKMSDAMQRLRDKLDDAKVDISPEAENSTISQISVDDRPILTIVLYGNVDSRTISRVSKNLEDTLERLSGVNKVEVGGLREEIVQIQLRPERILAMGISPVQVKKAIQAANLDMPWGEIENEEIGAVVRLYGRFRDINDLKRLPVARFGGAGGERIVALGEIAEVRRDLEPENTRASFSWKGDDYAPGVEISINKVPGSDTIAVIESVKNALVEAEQSQSWPHSVHYRISQNEAERIEDSLRDVFNNAWQAMLAVFFILFLLLTWREGLIAGLCIPLTFSGALLITWMVGYSLNELVIIGMVLALGLLVDVFILMMEGMHEGIFIEHLSFEQSALKTVRKYGLPAAAGQATTILALAPLAAIGGVSGKFIRVLPITAITCLSMAFLVAILISIPLSRYFLSGITKKKNRTTTVDRLTTSFSSKVKAILESVALRNNWVAGVWVCGAILLFITSLRLFSSVPVIMYPKGDGLKLGINIELSAGATLDSAQKVADQVGELLRKKTYLESVVKLVGKKSPFASVELSDALQPSIAPKFVGFSAIFVPLNQRKQLGYLYADELREEINTLLSSSFAGASLVVVPETGQPSAQAPVQIELMGNDMDLLRSISKEVQLALRQIPGSTDVRDNLGSVKAEINLLPRREVIDFYGLTQQDLADQVRYSMGVVEVGKFSVGDLKDDLPIQLSVAWPSRAERGAGGPTRLDEFSMVRAFTPKGGTVSLLSLLEPRMGASPTSITHRDGRRSISVLAKTDDTPPILITEALRPILDQMMKTWPSGYRYRFGGEAQETAETFASAGSMLIIAIMLIMGLLVLLFGSFIQSLIIVALMPLALIGTFLGFYLFHIPFSFFAMIGLISLIGIVVNDAIVMVDTMNTHLQKGLTVATSAARGASDRIRPIISTSLTTIVGLIPLAISNPMWRPMCFAIIFGLIVSTITSVIIVPCLFLLLTRENQSQESGL